MRKDASYNMLIASGVRRELLMAWLCCTKKFQISKTPAKLFMYKYHTAAAYRLSLVRLSPKKPRKDFAVFGAEKQEFYKEPKNIRFGADS